MLLVRTTGRGGVSGTLGRDGGVLGFLTGGGAGGGVFIGAGGGVMGGSGGDSG